MNAHRSQEVVTLRDAIAIEAMNAMLDDGVLHSSIPALAKATGRDAEWRKEVIDAVAKSAYDVADAMMKART